jgi:hypothetical protein
MAKDETIETDEAYAFVSVVAPRLEQLRQRLMVANDTLKSGDPETARLTAIVESQLAIKEFLVGITNLSPLIEPIDVLLEALREEAEAAAEPPPPTPEPAAPPRQQPIAGPAPSDAWLCAATAIAVEQLTNAGMPAAAADAYVQKSYATIGLADLEGRTISDAAIRDWRLRFSTASPPAWRRTGALRQRVGSPINALNEAKGRVRDLATMLKRVAQLMRQR